MSQRRLILPAVIAAAVLASGCADGAITDPDPRGTEPSDLFRSDAPPVSTAARGLDAEFVRISGEMPGFAGYFVDDEGVLNVRMAGTAQTRSAATVQQTLARVAPRGLGIAAGRQVRVLEATYDFAQLDKMHRAIAPVFALDGVVFTDADEVRNRVVVGVANGAARVAVERALEMSGVERAAIEIVETDPIVPMQSLQSRVRPVAGGLQINFPGFFCTLGFNVRAPQRPGVHGFVTNSHCTSSQGSMTSTPYWQNLSSTPDSFIGTEMHDVPFFTGGLCPAGRQCRWSDAAGVQYAPGVDVAFGRIYRTNGIGSLNIDASNPMWNIVAERPFPTVGDTLHKTGRTTGWSSGTVSQTCVNTGVSGTSITLLCQDWVLANVAGGDSGSPVFRRLGDGSDVELNGILWGGGVGVFVFSAMDNVRFENEGVVPWTTYAGQ